MYSITDTLINNTSESVIYKFVSYKLYLFQQSYLDKPDKVFIKGITSKYKFVSIDLLENTL